MNYYEANFQNSIQNPSEEVPANCSPREIELQREAVKFQKEVALMREQSMLDVWRHGQKRQIDEGSWRRMQEIRADIEIRKSMLGVNMEITENGEIIKSHALLTERPVKFGFANFRLSARPICYFCTKSNGAVLYLSVMLKNMKTAELYMDLNREKAGYYWKKFRNAGINFQKTRKEKADMIFDVIWLLCSPNIAETVELPSKKGFYVKQDGQLCYAGKSDLIWTEVKDYAR